MSCAASVTPLPVKHETEPGSLRQPKVRHSVEVLRMRPIPTIPVYSTTRVVVRRGVGVCNGISACLVWWYWPHWRSPDVSYLRGYGRTVLAGVWCPAWVAKP